MNVKQEVLNRLNMMTTGTIAEVDWCDRTIVFEDSNLSSLYYDDPNRFHQILEIACEGLGCFLELENTCSATLVQV